MGINLLGKKQLPNEFELYASHIGDKVKFRGINYFWQLYYYLLLDTETIYEISDILTTTKVTSTFKLVGVEDEFLYDSFRFATVKEIYKKLMLLFVFVSL